MMRLAVHAHVGNPHESALVSVHVCFRHFVGSAIRPAENGELVHALLK
jgi:hypothetical protein